MTEAAVLVERLEGVTTITLNRPQRLNALSPELMQGLRVALEGAATDDDCRCVLLTGRGRGFSSGADLSGLALPEESGTFDFGAPLEPVYHPVLRLLRGMDKPVVAAVNGVAAGAGCSIALAADIVVAARSACFIQAFVRIGLVPDAGGTWTIPRLIGRARAQRWMMRGDALDAETALQWGLITEVHDDGELPAAARTLATALASQPTRALAAIKQLVDASAQNDLDAQMALEAKTQTAVGYSQDTLEGISAFLQKRPARFSGQ